MLAVAIPPSALGELRRSYLTTGAQNALMYHALGQVIGHLQQAGVDVIVLKGAHLAEAVYGDIALRAMLDADILVRPQAIKQAIAVIEAQGYQPYRQYDLALEMRSLRHLPGYAKPSAPLIEIHYALGSFEAGERQKVDMNAIWERAEPEVIAGAGAFVLAPEALAAIPLLSCCLSASFPGRLEVVTMISWPRSNTSAARSIGQTYVRRP